MADALAVVSLVSAIVGFIDVGTRATTALQQIYNAGAYVPASLKDAGAQLPLLIELMGQIQQNATSITMSQNDSETLLQAINGCRRRCEELTMLIERSTIPVETSIVDRLKKVLGRIRHEHEILELLRCLEAYKSVISLKLLHDLRTMKNDTDLVNTRHYHTPSFKVLRFIGRTDSLQSIAETFRESVEYVPRVVVLVGMGGTGKTQIALEYCRQIYLNRTFQHIFWVDAASPNSIHDSYEKIAVQITRGQRGAQDRRSTIAFVKDALKHLSELWLMVYDNFDSPCKVPNLQGLLPDTIGTQGAILITSRHLDTCRLGKTIMIEEMNVSESLELLFHHTQYQRSQSNVALATRIVGRLGHLPLAIDQAAAYIKTRQLSLEVFDNQYKELRKTSLWSRIPQIWEYKKRLDGERQVALSVSTTWEMSLGEFEGHSVHQKSVGRLLSLMALFERSNLSERLVVALAAQKCQAFSDLEICMTNDQWDREKFQDILLVLYVMSIIQSVNLASELSSFSLHPMIAEWLKMRIRPEDRRSIIEAASATLRQVLSFHLNNLEGMFFEEGNELLGYIDNIIESAYDLSPGETELDGISTNTLITFAQYYSHFEKYESSAKLFKKAIDDCNRNPECQDISKDRLYYDLSFCYREDAKFMAAESMFEMAIKGRTAALGKDHPLTLQGMIALGVCYRRSQKHVEAERLLAYVVKIGPQALGLHHPSYLAAINNLAVVYRYQKRLEEAQKLAAKSFALRTETLGFLNVSTLDSQRCLGLVLRDQGKLKGAEDAFLSNLAGLEQLLGPLANGRDGFKVNYVIRDEMDIIKTASIYYLRRSSLYETEKPYMLTFDSSELEGSKTNHEYIQEMVSLLDAQATQTTFHLDVHGFEFGSWPTVLTSVDFDDDEKVKNIYYDEILTRVKEIRPKAKEIFVINHLRRKRPMKFTEISNEEIMFEGPVVYAHTDFTVPGAEIALNRFFEKEESHVEARKSELGCAHYEMLNVWRVTQGPNQDWPLALCDYTSIDPYSDLEATDIVHREWVGESGRIYHDDTHKWYFLDQQQVDDVLIFRNTDSRGLKIPC